MLSEKQRGVVSKIFELREELRNSEGKQAQKQINRFEVAFNIYSGNKNEVVKLLEKVADEDYAADLFTERANESRSEVYREFIRLFHNYSHSISFLINITRNLMREYYEDSKLLNNYQSKVDSIFGSNETAIFLKKLRNYFEHDQVPNINQQLSFSRNKENYSGFQLLRDKLLEEGEWNKESRRFLEKSEEKIDILTLIKEYDEYISLLYNWLFEELNKEHQSELEEMDKLKERLSKLHSQVDFAVL